MNGPIETTTGKVTISAGPRMRAAFILAILADLCQLVFTPMFVEGAISPADDALDIAMTTILTWLLGWHWEFAPSFFAKLVPGVDLVPLWTLAVANVYRKSRSQLPTTIKGSPNVSRYPRS